MTVDELIADVVGYTPLTYLGDAVYARYSEQFGWIQLITTDGNSVLNSIFLEWEVMDKLMEFAGEFR